MQLKRKYKHKRTGAIVFSSGLIIGDNWVEVGDDEKKGLKESGKKKEEFVEEEINLEQMTKAELIEFAKEHSIKINEKDTKAVIIDTIAKAFE